MRYLIPTLPDDLTVTPTADGQYALSRPGAPAAQLSSPAVAVLLLLDGQRTVDLIELHARRLGTPTPEGFVANLVGQLLQARLVEQRAPTEIVHHVLPGTAHTCEGCGCCCEGHAVGPLPADEAQRIQRLWPDLQRRNKRLKGYAPFRRLPDGEVYLNAQKGRCIFLDPDRRCTIHRHFGGAAKPSICQLFPFRRVLAEDGLRLGVSPRCFRHHRHAQPSHGPAQTITLDGELASLPTASLDRAPLPSAPFTWPTASEQRAQHAFLQTERLLITELGRPDATLRTFLAVALGAPAPAAPPGALRLDDEGANALGLELCALHPLLEESAADLKELLGGDTHVAHNARAIVEALHTCRDLAALTLDPREQRFLLASLRHAIFTREPALFPNPLPALLAWIGGFLLASWRASVDARTPEDRFDHTGVLFTAFFRLLEGEAFEDLPWSPDQARDALLSLSQHLSSVNI